MSNPDELTETVPTVLNGADGRQADGKFAVGNQAAAGRRSRSKDLRAAFESAVTPEAMGEVTEAMLRAARLGDVSAAKLITDQCLVKPNIEAIVEERIEAWKYEFVQELFYLLDPDTQDQILRRYTTGTTDKTEELIKLFAQLRTFRDIRDYL